MPFTSEQIIFLINPHSGNGKHEELLKELIKLQGSVHYHICQNKNHLASFFNSFKKQFKVVVICGGDGTVNSVLQYAVNTDLVFAIWPRGSGNGFAREMGYRNKLAHLLSNVQYGNIRKVDVFNINSEYFCNMSGIGFDAFIADRFDKNNKRGLPTYINETIKGFFEFKSFSAILDLDGNISENEFFMLSMANTRQFGNNVIIAPNANFEDGQIELVALKKFPKIIAPCILLKLLSRKCKNSKYIQYISARRLKIKTEHKYFHIDGEPRKNADGVIEVNLAGAIKIISTEK